VSGPALVLTALPEEAHPLRERLVELRRWEPVTSPELVGVEGWTGSLGGRETIVAVTGDGMWNAERRADAVIARAAPSVVIVAGVAGGLSAELDALDCVVAESVARESGQVFRADEDTVARATASAGAQAGTVLTAERLACSVADKRSLLERIAELGLAVHPALVDMESAAIVGVAEARAVPWTVIRVVSDAAGDELPAFLRDCYDPSGGVDRKLVARQAMLSPGSVPVLLKLANRVKQGSQRLAETLERVLAARVGDDSETVPPTPSASSS